MSRTFKPLYSRVLVKLSQNKGLSAGGLYMPNTNAVSNEGEVIEAGADTLFVQPGDIVVVDRGETRGISVDEPNLVLVKEEHILAIVHEARSEN